MSTIKRKSFNAINKIYFFTATIHNWFPLLLEDNNQQLIIDYLKKLSDKGYIAVYGFILMPNHIHLILLTADRYGCKTNLMVKKHHREAF